MPLVKVKPTSPGRRALVKVVNPELHKGDPYWPLVEPQRRGSGRNNYGRVTMRHQGGGHKHHLRLIDWRRDKDKIAAKVERLEYDPNRSAHLARSAGAHVQVLAREGSYAQLRLRSGEIRKVHIDCRATIGEVGNAEHNLESIGKAGRVRWRGVRPTVRGVAMNPIDHPHGGGEGRTAAAQPPVSPWGVQTKGYKTRKNKRTQVMIVRDRRVK